MDARAVDEVVTDQPPAPELAQAMRSWGIEIYLADRIDDADSD